MPANVRKPRVRAWLGTASLVLILSGAVLLLSGTGAVGYRLWRISTFAVSPAEVAWFGEMCEMDAKTGKTSYAQQAVVPCADSDAYRAARPEETWRIVRADYARVVFNREGPRETLVRGTRLHADERAEGRVVNVYVNPENPGDVETRVTGYQAAMFALWISTGAAALVAGMVLRARGRRQASSMS